MRSPESNLPAAPLLRAAQQSGAVPLSPSQARLWFLHVLAPASAQYNIASAWRLRGAVDAPALDRSLCAIVGRHQVLRAKFLDVDGLPTQVIEPAPEHVLHIVDVMPRSGTLTESEILAIVADEAAQPFDLRTAAVYRARLLRLADTDHILLLTLHHIACDGWSLGVLHRELSGLYAADGAISAVSIPDLTVQYADVATWQLSMAESDAGAAQLRYWQRVLAGAQRTSLSADRRRPEIQSGRGALCKHDLRALTLDRLRQVAREASATVFMASLAAFGLLLRRCTGADDITIGTLVAGRTRAAMEPLIGCFVNTLATRITTRSAMTYRALLIQTRDVMLDAFANQDIPFERVVETLPIDRDARHNPLFDVMFTAQQEQSDGLTLRDVASTPIPTMLATSRLDLIVSLVQTKHQVAVVCEYSTDLFDASTIAAFLRAYEVLLAQVMADPDKLLDEYRIVTGTEEAELVQRGTGPAGHEYRDGAASGDWRALCVDELVRAQALRTPAAAAVCGPDGRVLTYSELEERANGLAHRLRALGAGPEVPVAVCVTRSMHLVIAILAIWKAGAAYVPLAPETGSELLRFLLDDSRAPLVIAEEQFRDSLPASDGRTILFVAGRGGPRANAPPEAKRAPHNLAYIIYTSGSTGRDRK